MTTRSPGDTFSGPARPGEDLLGHRHAHCGLLLGVFRTVAGRERVGILRLPRYCIWPDTLGGTFEPRDTRQSLHGGSWRPLSRGCATSRYRARFSDRIKLLILDSLGCALFGSELEWSRILMRTLTRGGQLARLRRVGDGRAAFAAACGARQRHAGAGLRARRCASPGRAACRRGHAAAALCRGRAEARHERARVPARGGRGLRGRPARRHVHGPGAHRAGLAFGRDGRRVLRRGGRGARDCGCRRRRWCTRSASRARSRRG